MSHKPPAETSTRPTPVLAVAFADKFVELYPEDRRLIDFQVIYTPDVGQRNAESDLLIEAWLETRIRSTHRNCYWPSNIAARIDLSRCSPPTRRLAVAERLQLCRDLDAIGRKYSTATSSTGASR